MALPLATRLEGLLGPARIHFLAMQSFFVTVYKTVWVQRSPLKLLQLNSIRAKAFSRLWLAMSPPPDSQETPADDPESAFANLPTYLSAATGTVLDIGPGSGTFVTYYHSPSIQKIYGAEPGLDMHDALRKSAHAAGVGAKYEILPCGGERDSLLPALAKAGLLKEAPGGQIVEEGVFDTIVCIRVLCSVPNLEESVATLYALLRPGGRFVICEHVINPWWTPKGSVLGRAFQILYTLLGWSFFMGDCHMDRDTATLLKSVGDAKGGWDSVQLEKKAEWSALPFTSGVYIKKATRKM